MQADEDYQQIQTQEREAQQMQVEALKALIKHPKSSCHAQQEG